MDTQTEKLTIQQVAEATGLIDHTLRYYERIGLIHPINRAVNTHRRYTADDVGWIEFLTKLRNAGMSIRQMQAYAESQRQGDSTLPERLEMLKAHINAPHEHLDRICYKINYYQNIVDEKSAELNAQPSDR